MLSYRNSCIICNTKAFEQVYTESSMPASLSATNEHEGCDLEFPFTVVGCKVCKCVQTGELVDPTLLYSESHNNTANSSSWREHHAEFAKFILTHMQSEGSVLEIGGSDGYLARHLLDSDKNLDLSSLDMCSTHANLEGIKYLSGNCEIWDYANIHTVLLSHVFEHLYNPTLFIESLSKGDVKDIFLSIPLMKKWLETNVLSFIHREHTYYCDDKYLVYLFQKKGYALQNSMNFKEHSEFFWFSKAKESIQTVLPERDFVQEFITYYEKRDAKLSQINVKSPTYIFPAGHYGQLVYTFLKKKGQEKFVLGFLDNDPDKIGKRMYGTPNIVYSPSIIKDKSCNIILAAGVYKKEIRDQLLALSTSLNILEV